MRYQTTQHHIYSKLIRLIPELELLKSDTNQISYSEGFMNLYLNILREETTELGASKIISLSHYYEQNGDLVSDPDMTIRVYLQGKMAEALTFQNPFIYQAVYPTPTTFYPDLKIKLNSFLNSWLKNCLQQDHKFSKNKTKLGEY